MSKLLLTIAVSTVAAWTAISPVSAQTRAVGPALAPAVVQSNAGDWALGRWTGYQYPDGSVSRLVTKERVLVVEKLAGGGLGCKWADSADAARSASASACTVTASTISLRTASKAGMQLNLSGRELEGEIFEVGGHQRVHLHRGDSAERR